MFIFESPFGITGGVALAVCFILAPFGLCRGSEGWRTFTNIFGLMLAFSSFAGSFALFGEESVLAGACSFFVFLKSCYLIKVFVYNGDVGDYLAYLRKSKLRYKILEGTEQISVDGSAGDAETKS